MAPKSFLKLARQLVLSIAVVTDYTAERRLMLQSLQAWVNGPGRVQGPTIDWPTETGRWQRRGVRYEARVTSDGVMVFDFDADIWRYASDKRHRGGWQQVEDAMKTSP